MNTSTIRRSTVTLNQYAELCSASDVTPNYHPAFVEYYFGRLNKRPKIIGLTQCDRIVAAFPTMFGQVFPTSIHKRLLGKRFNDLGEIGQPETLFPVLPEAGALGLNRLSLTTSPLLLGRVRAVNDRSLKAMAIAKDRRHKKLTIRQRDFFAGGGKAHFAGEMSAKDFADIYLRLHSERWGMTIDSLSGVREQIIALHRHVFGVVLELNGEPVAVQLCFRSEGASMHCVDFINSGVRLLDDNKVSYGSVMMLTTLRRAEEDAKAAGKALRFSFGYYYGDNTYKSVWTEPEPTFIGY